ncbi:hypothetical protein EYB25_003687 [Talaromyces marneffei]|nr:hypothetical protein EYB25_003687 [Talaromyces marneffei]
MAINHDHQAGSGKSAVSSTITEANWHLRPSADDVLDQIWSWNSLVRDQIQGCVHDLISEIAQRPSSTGSLAVCAWDGDFTYPQLDSIADEVAHHLIWELNIAPRLCIPILFHKSKWTCVAMLAVIKAGCSVVALDPAQPDSRLLSILEQVEPCVMISSETNYGRACTLRRDLTVLQIDESWLLKPLNKPAAQLPTVTPSDIVYISFTSGTTGQPKGACISHANVRSTVQYQGAKLGFNAESRVFDFAPYSFDVAWSNFLHTLCAGGCLCIAREEDMLNDTSVAIAAFKATLINVTPTVLRTINSEETITLETVLLSGEMPYRENITKWSGHVRLLNTYGPTECTFKAAFSVLSDPSSKSTTALGDEDYDERPDIGRGVGFCTWIVDPNDGNKLVDSIGSIGELYLEGPQVGQGYISDPEKTEAVFIEDPSWLLAGSQSFPGRKGRVYKTGDLVRYKPDGRLVFLGRNDPSQVKVRGQRVEVGDVEHHVRSCLDDSLPIIVESIRPRGSESSSLTVKITSSSAGFMLPSLYFPIDKISVATTGKVDRRQLREMGSALTWEELVRLQSTILSVKEYAEPVDDIERQLCEIWADILDLDPARISTTDNFLRLGGDSIAAMHVVASARKKNLSLTVADIFMNPVLRDLAQCVLLPMALHDMNSTDGETKVLPFSLLGGSQSRKSICEEAARLCQLEAEDIEDIYPCTPLQEGMLSMSVKNGMGLRENYISRTAFEMHPNIDIGKLQKALLKAVRCIPILRTRVINLPQHGLVQVVVRSTDSQSPPEYSHIAQFFDEAKEIGLGKSLYRTGIVLGDGTEPNLLVLEMHHAIFDGWCTMLILDSIQESYHNTEDDSLSSALAPFPPFIKHILETDNEETKTFWKDQLADSEAIAFPVSNYSPEKKLDLHHPISGLVWPRNAVTPPSIIRSALAILLASYTNSGDIKYGETVSGRQAPVSCIERMAGPTIASVPVRVKFDWDQTVQWLQQKIQNQAAEIAKYEQFGLQRIRRIDEEASKFQLELVIQPSQKGKSQSRGGLFHQAKTIVVDDSSTLNLVAKDGIDDSMSIYNSYAMMIICQLTDSGLTLKINFDTGAIKQKQVHRFAHLFEHIVRQLSSPKNADTKLRDLSIVSNTDLNEIQQWNGSPPQVPIDLVADRIDRMATTNPEATSISSWDWQLTYHQLQHLTTSLACKLQGKGICAGDIVILSFQKSSWMILSMLSVLKLGAIVLPMSDSVSRERAHEIVKTLHPQMMITSQTATSSSFTELVPTFQIHDLIQSNDDDETMHDFKPHNVQLSDPALIIFTSGSTGTPKSILWSHETLSSNICAATQTFGITAHSKVFQFAGYEFDVSTVESLSVLSVGGILYVPSESDRTNRLSEAMHDSQANWICLTPRVSETLNPRDIHSLKTIVFAGEELKKETAFRWLPTLDSVYNWYGPAEGSVATSYVVQKETWSSGIIGTSTPYATTWLVDPKDHKSLASIGAVAELCIEGPVLSWYTGLNGAELNKKHFFSPAGFGDAALPRRQGPRILYKTGDLVKYGPDGEIIFLGRIQDSQRKLHGQRVDLSEIERHVHDFLSGKLDVMVVAEIFSPLNSNNDVLALFLSPTDIVATNRTGNDTFEEYIKTSLSVDDLETILLRTLPLYMIPKLYIPISNIPISNTGKTDRRRLRAIGSSFCLEQLAEMQPSRQDIRKPSTDTEKLLQQLWADIIGIDMNSISANDNFLRLGGDSIAVMRLVASARTKGLILTVTDIFESPELENQAQRGRREKDIIAEEEIAPFSLLNPSLSEAEYRAHAASACSIAESRIVNMYPCTPLQEGLLVLGEKIHGQYVSRSVLELQTGIDCNKLERAWLNIVNRLPILRTRIIDTPLGHQGLLQVVLDSLPLRLGSDVSTYLDADEKEHMGLGTDLCRAVIIDRSFVLTIHHCIYDGNVLKMILNEFESQYLAKNEAEVVPFENFIQRLTKINLEEAAAFWKQQLSLSEELRSFPELPYPGYKPQANTELEHTVRLVWPKSEITPSTIVRSCWALLTSQYVSSSNVVFGVTVSGRQIDVKGIENCIGPTISTIPLPVSIDWDNTVGSFLAQMQRQGIEMMPYEQYGVQSIQHIVEGPDSAGSLFQSLLVVQPVAQGKSLNEDNLLFKARNYSSSLETLGIDPFNTYPLMLICELSTFGLQLRFSFDNNVIDKQQIERIAYQLDNIIHQVCMDNVKNIKLDDIETASKIDLDLFCTQNRDLPVDVDRCLHDLITMTAKKTPDTLAIDAWDGVFSYQEVDELSSLLCQRMISLGVSKDSVIALCFEKSKWTPIAQVAVLKAGAVALLQSVHVPDHRIGTVFKKASVHLAVASASRVETVSQYVPCFTIDQLLEYPTTSSPQNNQKLPTIQMNDPAAILVSSGSTGEPKQILWSHRTLSANIRGHQEHIPMNASARIFQFASYDFDLATLETMSALSMGACLCIPSETEKMDNLTAAINRLKPTHLHMTPSTADLLQPESIPSVSTVILAGEKLVSSSVDRWKAYSRVFGWYGPAECASAAFIAADTETWYSGVISCIESKQHSLCWLVDPRNPERLAPYGAIGEIALEGPTSSDGYIGNPTLTQNRFRRNPKFLGGSSIVREHTLVYYTGDLARYGSDGNLVILGRKDAQLKIRGQLVVPEEVEHHIKSCLPNGNDMQVIVDIIKVNKDKRPILVAFIQHSIEHEVRQMTDGLQKQLAKVLPRYAIPSYYLPIPRFPKTATDKVDRARLRENGESFDLVQQLESMGLKRREPATTAEKTLQKLWATAIGISPDDISVTDSFLQVGDSIRAMRLVGLIRQQGMLLTVADVFEYPILEDMAMILRDCNEEDATSQKEIASYSLLGEQDIDGARKQAASICSVNIDDIEDVFPCTRMQEGLLSLTVAKKGNYTGRNIFQLASSVDIERFKRAWEKVVVTIPILRTRIIDLPGRGLLQVVIKPGDCWTEMKDIEDFVEQETRNEMGLGCPLMRCGLFSTSSTQDTYTGLLPIYFALTMHHSIYDGITTNLIFGTFENFYHDIEQPILPLPFQPFLRYVGNRDTDAESHFWKTQFAALEAPQFPPLPSSAYQPETDSVVIHCIPDISWRQDNFTPTTVIYAAFAFLCSYHSNSSDVVFGTVVSGRKLPVAGIERLAGPTIATVPVRVRIDGDDSAWGLLNTVQKQTTEMIPYEQTGLSVIRQISDEAEQACQFQTFVVIQPEETDLQGRTGLFSSQVPHVWSKGKSYGKYGDHGFNPCALTIACTMRGASLDIEFSFDSNVLDERTVQRMSFHFEHILRNLCDQINDKVQLRGINMTMNQDLDQIWEWNSEVPEVVETPLHELVSIVSAKQPDATAISAWNGELTYQNFERLTTNIAHHLKSMGVKRNMIIPLLFEKSIFAPVAFFAIIKAGGAGLLLDPTLPESRLLSTIQQVEPVLIISSVSNGALAAKLCGSSASAFSLNWEVAHTFMENDFDITFAKEPLPKVDPSDLLYAIFTSGSTGTPKGCLMQHRNFSSAVVLQQQVLGLKVTSRMYDFSSYSFDAAHWGMFHVLAAGGTLCIPSEDERKNKLSESMRQFKTTDVFLTPSVARFIDPTRVPTLRNIHLGGEEATRDDFARWVPHANTFNSYGPAECSAGTLYGKIPSVDLSKISIGTGSGVCTWIVDPKSKERLSPIGTVGELYLEGPLVGQGYLGDEVKNADSFIEDPPWLLAGSPDGCIPGRQGRLYKTGDLVKYDLVTGQLFFIGRKDTQVKLRGQRIELSEIEYHVRQCVKALEMIPLTVEIIKPNATNKQTLVLFLQFSESESCGITKLLHSMEPELRQRIPSYMIPDAYIVLDLIPLTGTGKTDRRRLREIGADAKLHHFGQQNTENSEPPSSAAEIRLQQLWTNILNVLPENIHKNSNFFHLGGDSISAMRLAALARNQGLLSLTVQNILSAPRLSDLANFMTTSAGVDKTENISPFSLLAESSDKDQILDSVARQCDVDASQIEDIFPCTSVQKSLLSMTAKDSNSYIAQLIIRLKEDVDLARLQQAWKHVSQTSAPILRVKIVDVPGTGLVQVQINESVQWESSYEDVMSYINHEQTRSMGLSTSLTRIAVVRDSRDSGRHCLLLTQHHAIYDGYSMDLLLQEVSKAYIGVSSPSYRAPFQSFLKYVMSTETEEATKFWEQQFFGSEAIPFPALPHQDYQPKADSTVRRELENIVWPGNGATVSTVLRAAWSIIVSQHTDSKDVVFGAIVSGRQAPVSGIDRMIAPLINAVPVRVKAESTRTVDELLGSIQEQAVSMIPFEHTELLTIRRINVDTDRGTRFNTLLVVQPLNQGKVLLDDDGPFPSNSVVVSARSELDDFNPNAVMIMCQQNNRNGLYLEISFDSNVIKMVQMERISAQFEHVLRRICASCGNGVKIDEIDAISTQDVSEIWKWNESVPETIEMCVHDLIYETIETHPEAPAICSWDGRFSYRELDHLSGLLALQLIALGAKRGSIVPLCFEKSSWHPVAALAIMKAGAVCLSMDMTQPESRLRSIVGQVKPTIIISSKANRALAAQISDSQVVIGDREHIFNCSVDLKQTLPKVYPSDNLYIVFTSGSTGTPKGVVTTHQNFSSAATHQKDILNIRNGTRVYDFVSYNFDVSWSNTLQTLICGGCLCIPSEWERKNDITGSLNRMNCDYVYFTPSVARSLQPSSMPGIRTLTMGGEPIRTTDAERWTQAETIIGIYGPAECAQALSFVHLGKSTPNNRVGHSFGANTWLVQPGRPDCLAAIGTVGELLIEGPTVSKGYFGNEDRTNAAYIKDPEWLVRGIPGVLQGRRGTLYKTGDLLSYSSDGSLNFIGRKDTMIKLRGQRIELEEVEHHVRASLNDASLFGGIAAEIITPQNATNALLALFFSLRRKESVHSSEEDIDTLLTRGLEGLENALSLCLPQYMIPGAYIHIDKIPMTTTNKIDRRALRQHGNAQTLEDLAKLQSHGKSKKMPKTDMELRLQSLWATVLGIDPGSIGADSSFLRIGGESIAAMRLVAAARDANLSLTVAEIFKAPRLSQLALIVKENASTSEGLGTHPPFSLLETDEPQHFIQQYVLHQLDSNMGGIRDILPTTDFQQLAISDALQSPPSRLPHLILELPEDVDFARLQDACESLIMNYEILHTSFIQVNGKVWQALLPNFRPAFDIFDADNKDITDFVNDICAKDINRPRKFGQSFIRFMAVKHRSGTHKLVFRISHAQFDGFSLGSILQTLSSIYNKDHLAQPISFSNFIAFITLKKPDSLRYWASRLEGSCFPGWPSNRLQGSSYDTTDRLTMKRTILMPDINRQEGVSAATIFHAACAITFSQQYRQEEVLFGRLVTGRSMLPSTLQNVVGPCMTEVPIRITIVPEDTIITVALRLQNQFIEDSFHEAVGMAEIVATCTDWSEEAKDFGWRTAFQQEEDTDFEFLRMPSSISYYEGDLPARTRPEIYATPRDGRLELEFEGNRNLTSEQAVQEFFAGLEMVLGEY